MTHRNGAGTYHRPMPLDFLILELLPEKGMLGGIHWKGRRVKDLREEIIEQQNLQDDPSMLTRAQVHARLRSLHTVGLVENFPAAGGGGAAIWARTEEGTAHLGTRAEVLGE